MPSEELLMPRAYIAEATSPLQNIFLPSGRYGVNVFRRAATMLTMRAHKKDEAQLKRTRTRTSTNPFGFPYCVYPKRREVDGF
jgi:hypothetical protein